MVEQHSAENAYMEKVIALWSCQALGRWSVSVESHSSIYWAAKKKKKRGVYISIWPYDCDLVDHYSKSPVSSMMMTQVESITHNIDTPKKAMNLKSWAHFSQDMFTNIWKHWFTCDSLLRINNVTQILREEFFFTLDYFSKPFPYFFYVIPWTFNHKIFENTNYL